MKKRKTYEISVIDKTYSKTISDETKFYTSDTALELMFKLKETEYTFESAEIVLLNIDDRSLVTRPVSKVNNDFVYELDDDIIPHYGEWHGQLRFEAGEIYVSSPVKFRIENDLSNERPPQLSDVQSWVSLRRYADSLTEELKQAVLSIEGIEDTFNENETARQTTFETAEQSRQDAFEDAESERDETFNANEVLRQENETARQQAENHRQTTFETNETERQNTFETAEHERQSAELIRIENENQRNLTSVDEFIKLQNAVGGRNYLLKSSEPTPITLVSNSPSTLPLTKGVENGVDWVSQHSTVTNKFIISTYISESFSGDTNGVTFSKGLESYNGDVSLSVDVMSTKEVTVRLGYGVKIKLTPNLWSRLETYNTRPLGLYADSADNENVPVGTKVYWKNYKIEKGTQVTPYTKAPEDYTVVSKDDYYNHINLMNEFKDNQFNQLKQAVIALGGTI